MQKSHILLCCIAILTALYLACHARWDGKGAAAARTAKGIGVVGTARTGTLARRARLPVHLPRIRLDESYKTRAYAALKQAIVKMDIYATPEPVMLDEREISERIGVSRTPVREAIAMLEQDGFVRVVPRRGILVVRKTKREIIEMVQAWAALESMAVRLLVACASDAEISSLRDLMRGFEFERSPDANLGEYSDANLEFHQRIIALSKSGVLAEMTDKLLLHVRGIRALTIGRHDRAKKSVADHLAIINAIEQRDADLAERLSRAHTLGLAAYVEAHGDELFG